MSKKRRPSPDRNEFVERLKTLTPKPGDVNALAKQSGLSVTALRNYLVGGEPTRPALLAIARAKNVSVAWLASGQDDPSKAGDLATDSVLSSHKRFVGIRDLIPEWDSLGTLRVRIDNATTFALDREWAMQKLKCDPVDLLHVVSQDRDMDDTIRVGSSVLVNSLASATTDGHYVLKFADQFLIRRLQFLGSETAHVTAPAKGTIPWVIKSPRANTEVTFYGKVVWWSCLG